MWLISGLPSCRHKQGLFGSLLTSNQPTEAPQPVLAVANDKPGCPAEYNTVWLWRLQWTTSFEASRERWRQKERRWGEWRDGRRKRNTDMLHYMIRRDPWWSLNHNHLPLTFRVEEPSWWALRGFRVLALGPAELVWIAASRAPGAEGNFLTQKHFPHLTLHTLRAFYCSQMWVHPVG